MELILMGAYMSNGLTFEMRQKNCERFKAVRTVLNNRVGQI